MERERERETSFELSFHGVIRPCHQMLSWTETVRLSPLTSLYPLGSFLTVEVSLPPYLHPHPILLPSLQHLLPQHDVARITTTLIIITQEWGGGVVHGRHYSKNFKYLTSFNPNKKQCMRIIITPIWGSWHTDVLNNQIFIYSALNIFL